MSLPKFTRDLIEFGVVTVDKPNFKISSTERSETIDFLVNYYQEDLAEMPGIAPSFDENAAIWAATYFYKAVQLVINRDIKQAEISRELSPYEEQIMANSIYSADLIFRHIRSLFELAKGLAPSDIVVERLRGLAFQWPYSSVGIEIDKTADINTILSDDSLRQVYVDRIIQLKDNHRADDPVIQKLIISSVGNHIEKIWPQLTLHYKTIAS